MGPEPAAVEIALPLPNPHNLQEARQQLVNLVVPQDLGPLSTNLQQPAGRGVPHDPNRDRRGQLVSEAVCQLLSSTLFMISSPIFPFVGTTWDFGETYMGGFSTVSPGPFALEAVSR